MRCGWCARQLLMINKRGRRPKRVFFIKLATMKVLSKEEKEFLELAVFEQKKYADIAIIMKVENKQLSAWWDSLKPEREELSKIRKIWTKKFDIKTKKSFDQFVDWHNKKSGQCEYCGITEEEIARLEEVENKQGKALTKRSRGSKLEIERASPNARYDEITNLTMACYWCNNAKTDTFSHSEFIPVGKVIKNIWQQRLSKSKI